MSNIRRQINIIVIIVLLLIYLGCFIIAILGTDNPSFLYFKKPKVLELISLSLFLSTLYFGYKNIKYYSLFLVFNILALPSIIDNIFPSVLISAPNDLSKVYFPIITHIDIYLVFGIVIFYKINKRKVLLYMKSSKWKALSLLSFLLFISITFNIIKNSSVYDIGLILSYSYHLRYLLLLLLIFLNCEMENNKQQIFKGILISVVFLLIESIVYSYIYNDNIRLTSGTLGNNVFANFLAAVVCYYCYLIFRGIISKKYLILIVLMLICVWLTKTRSALFLIVIFLSFEQIVYTIKLMKQNLLVKAVFSLFILSALMIAGIYKLSNNERMTVTNFKIQKIDLSKKKLNEIIKLEDNDFNASLILRLNHYQTSIDMIQEDPLFGIGAGRWNRYKNDYGSLDRNVMDSHNDFLAAASQYGIPAGVLLCFNIYILPLFLSNTVVGDEFSKNVPINFVYIINLMMFFAGLSNTGLFKHQVYGFLVLLLMITIFTGSDRFIR